MRILVPREDIESTKSLLFKQCPQSGKEATTRDVFNMAGKLCNLTYVCISGWYVFRAEIAAADRAAQPERWPKQIRTVGFGTDIHDDLFWKWAIYHELLHEGEELSAPCCTARQRPGKKHYLSDASFEVVGGFCVERKVVWMYDLPNQLTQS